MKTKLFSVIFSIIFLFIIHMKPAQGTPWHTITARKVSFSYAYIKATEIVYFNGDLTPPDRLIKMHIPLSSISHVDEVKEEGR